jgi:uncharacterized protein (TIGR02444 family)
LATGNDERAEDSDDLWRFSLRFYAVPGVSEALIALQDRDGLDVNLMLFALWLGVSGRGRLSNRRLAAADRAIGTIRAKVVEPLRALRRKLKSDPDAGVQRLREGVQALELAGEKLVQTRLARVAGPIGDEFSPDAGIATALGNLALYLGPERVGSAEAVAIREAFEAFARNH